MIIYPLPPQELDDATLSKQIQVVAQVLCNVHHIKFAYAGSYEDAVKSANKHIPMPEKYSGMPWSQWASLCRANYLKLVDMGLACCEEWIYRFSEEEFESIENVRNIHKAYLHVYNPHKLQPVIEWCAQNIPDLDVVTLATKENHFPLCVPDKYIISDYTPSKNSRVLNEMPNIVESYRNYYKDKLKKGLQRTEECKICEKTKAPHQVSVPRIPNWSRRPQPAWLDFTWTNNIP